MARHLVAVGGSGQHVALAYLDLYSLALGVLERVEPPQLYVLDRDRSSASQPSAWQEALDQKRRIQIAVPTQKWAQEREIDAFDPAVETERDVRSAVSPSYGRVLFDEEQLKVSFRDGYYGQAPVAAAFFGNACERSATRTGSALHHIASDHGRVVVAGSVIGGTGAGCLPRLTEFLGGDENSVLTTVLLNWFRLTDSGGGKVADALRRTAEMKGREPSALVYAREQLKRSAATVLLGNPSPTPTERQWQGDTQQSFFLDLTIPYYAAALATQFHAATTPRARGLYGVVCPPIDSGVGLAGGTPLFQPDDGPITAQTARIENLAALNVELCLRLGWATRYLEAPPDASDAWFRGEHRVPSLDRLYARDPEASKTLHSLLEAKWTALRRLAACNPHLLRDDLQRVQQHATWREAVASRELPSGLPGLARWIEEPLRTGDAVGRELASPAELAEVVAASLAPLYARWQRQPDSVHRLLPEARPGATAPSPKEPGTLELMQLDDTERYLAYEKIAPKWLPTPQAVEFYLEKGFANRLGPANSPEFAKWRDRWRILLLGLCDGRFNLADSRPEDARVKLMDPLPQALVVERGEVVGYVSPRTLLVPAVHADWERYGNEIEPARLAGAMASVAGWGRFLEELYRFSPAEERPAWLNAVVGFLDDERYREFRVAPRFGVDRRQVSVNWGDRRSVAVSLPSKNEEDHGLVDDLVRSVLGIEIEKWDLSNPPPEFAGQVDLSRCPRYWRHGKGGSMLRRAVWDGGKGSPADAIRFGIKLSRTSTGALRAHRVIDSGAPVDVLSPQDVLLQSVELLGQENGRAPDYPVAIEFADLVDTTQPPAVHVVPGASVAYTFALKGYGNVSCSPSITGSRVGTVMFWPKFKALGPSEAETFKAYYVMADTGIKDDRVAVLGRTSANDKYLSRLVDRCSGEFAQPLYSQKSGEVQGVVPELFTLVDDERDGKGRGAGLFRIALEPVRAAPGADERWGVDFGTSSSVVAVSGSSGLKAVAFAPSGQLDQTLPVLVESPKPRKNCKWFPTWDGEAPSATSRPLFPSQLIVLKERVGQQGQPTYGTDYVIDHGGELQLENRLRGDFKWIDSASHTETSRDERRRYLTHLLELCVAMRPALDAPQIGVQAGMPGSFHAVFTLPIAMLEPEKGDHSPDRLLAEDIDQCCRTVQQLVGRSFTCSFEWESHAATVSLRDPSFVYAIADLGGGSLDMWGAIGNEGKEFADSYRFGGHDLLRQWGISLQANEAQLRRDLQTGTPAQRVLQTAKPAQQTELRDATDGYFELVTEACARWVAGLAHEAAKDGGKGVTVFLTLLGMGWGLHRDALRDRAEYDNYLKWVAQRANKLLNASGVKITIRGPSDFPEGDDRKTFLARRAAGRKGASIADLRSERPVTTLGFDLEIGPAPVTEVRWTERTDFALEKEGLDFTFRFDGTTTAQPSPALEHHWMNDDELARVIEKMTQQNPATPPLKFRGESPLALVLEVLRENPRRRNPPR